MLNNGSIDTITLGTDRQFIVNSMPYKAVGCRVAYSAANGTDSEGRNICKMGTPLAGDLTNRQTAMVPATATNCIGVLVHDVPLYEADQDANGSLLIDGGIQLQYVDTDVQAQIRATNLMNPDSNIKVITKL